MNVSEIKKIELGKRKIYMDELMEIVAVLNIDIRILINEVWKSLGEINHERRE